MMYVRPLMYHCDLKPNQKNYIHECYGMLVVLLRCLFISEIMHRGGSEVFLHIKAGTSPYDLYYDDVL
jgi:hypothetical protein